MKASWRVWASGGSVAWLASIAAAYVQIDNFLAGPYTATINWPNTVDTHSISGLDRSQCLFGTRGTDLTLETNPNHVPVNLAVGSGEAKVSVLPGQNSGLASVFTIYWSRDIQNPVDFSGEDTFWVDLKVSHPDNRFADRWSLRVYDVSGTSGVNDGFLTHSGGIYFRKSGFVGLPDWSMLRQMVFLQDFDSQGGTHPESYTVTHIFATTGPWTEVVPNSVTAVFGKWSNGNDPQKLAHSDNDFLTVCRFIVPNLVVAPVTVVADATWPFVPRQLTFKVLGKMVTAGQFSITLDMWDWTAGQYDTVDAKTFVLPIWMLESDFVQSGDPQRYCGPSREARARIRVKPTGVVASLAWCVDLDQWVLYAKSL